MGSKAWGHEASSVHSTSSSYREALLEHLLVGELMRALWRRGETGLEVSKPQVDAAGYDLILELRGIIRHVQLKSSHRGAKTRSVNVNLALTKRPSGCVIWTLFDDNTLELSPFLWFGSEPGQPLPDISDCDIARHTKGDATGHKGERPGLREVTRSRFEEVQSIDELLVRLFGNRTGRMPLFEGGCDK